MRMSTRTIAALGMAVVATVAGSASAGGNVDKATGGGQILLSSDGRGPGDTITFTAQAREGDDLGNVNVIDRTDNTGKGGVHYRADVACIVVEGNTAKISGVGQFKDGTTSPYTLIVIDNGEGALAEDDVIAFQYADDVTCEREDGDDDAQTALARGNAQVTDGDA